MGKSYKDYNDYDQYDSNNHSEDNDSYGETNRFTNRRSNHKKKNNCMNRNIKARRNEYGDLE